MKLHIFINKYEFKHLLAILIYTRIWPHTCHVYNNIKKDLFQFFAHLLVSIILVLPMFHLTFFSAIINSVTSIAWSEFVF